MNRSFRIALLIAFISLSPARPFLGQITRPSLLTPATANSFTLKIIFYGLIGLVPSRQNSDLWAILLDGVRAGVTEHVPAMDIYQGSCVDCNRYLTSSNIPRAGSSWSLKNLDLVAEIDPGRDPLRSLPPPSVSPRTKEEAAELGWIPSMVAISKESSIVKPSCLAQNITADSPCPAAARVRVAGWDEAASCHFLHGQDKRTEAFSFAPAGEQSTGSIHAIADALAFRWYFIGSSISFKVKSWGGADNYIELKPDNGLITLIIWNHPPGLLEQHHRRRHFVAYYKLAAEEPIKKPVPRGHRTDRTENGTCEVLFQDIYKGHDVAPHSIRECDLLFFSPDVLR
jgi:hypothetical protein